MFMEPGVREKMYETARLALPYYTGGEHGSELSEDAPPEVIAKVKEWKELAKTLWPEPLR